MTLNAILLLQFLTEAVILDGQASEMKLFKTFTTKISEYQMETPKELDIKGYESRSDKENTFGNIKYKDVSIIKEKGAVDYSCNNILVFIEAVAAKLTKVAALPLSLHMDKCTRE